MHVPVSPEINRLLDDAAEASVRRGRFYVGVEYVFEALLANTESLPKSFRKEYETTLRAALPEMGRELWRGTMPTSNVEIFYTPRCAALTSQAARLAERLGHEQPTAGHLLLAILADAHAAPSRALDRMGAKRGDMIQALRNELLRKNGTATLEAEGATPKPRPSETQHKSKEEEPEAAPSAKPSVVEKLTRDLTRMASHGKLEPAVGRDSDVMTIIEILARKTKNNVMLVGEAGVGKTRVVEGLAASIVTGGMGGILPNYRILELSLAALTAGTQYRGAFEEKLLALLDKLKRDDKTVLFIDEVHLIMGTGNVEGGTMDLANMLKPALARGEIRCIGATTMQEYRKFIEKDPAMERRFQLVRIEPLSVAATYMVLKTLRPSLEKHHSCRISKTALKAAIELTERYMPNRQLPDKAIDVLDQACSRYRLKQVAAKSNPKLFESSQTDDEDKVRPHDVRKVVSRATGIPIESITAEERVRLSDLERKLNRRLIGQEEAVSKVVAAVKKSRAGLGARNRPESVMMFLGPTGVGKTQLAKEMAKFLFGSASHLVTFDMSEYIEEHSVSRLLGAPPGYVGSDEEGRLTAAVRNTPFAVLLFDEVEKAHRRIFDIFLPILDEGRLKDSRGRMVDFRHCIILFTSNIGAELARRDADTDDRCALLDALHKHFRPEFINRIDEIVPFYPLVFEDIRKILQLSLRETHKRLVEKGMKLRVYQRAYEHLAEKGYDAKFGARELQRTVERMVVQPISEAMIDGRFQAGDIVEVRMEDGRLLFTKGEEHSKAEVAR